MSTTLATNTNLYIIGDSLSSPQECTWPNYVDAVVFNYAQAAVTLKEYDIPNHLEFRKPAKVVIYIGTNDALSGFGAIGFKKKLLETIYTVKFRGVDPDNIYVVSQPEVQSFIPNIDNFQAKTQEAANQAGVNFIDPGWGTSSTVDGLHPTCINHQYLGAWFNSNLEL